MDQYWREVADFLRARGLVGDHLVAPIEFGAALPLGFGYANAGPEDAQQIRSLVLHKGRYEELHPEFLRGAMARLSPVFANEVFILFAETGDPLPEDHPHLGHLREIRAWAARAREASAQPRRRMPATYVGNGAMLAETRHGHLITLPAADRAITPHMIRDGYFDLGVTSFLERFLRPGMTYVDVGANIGVYALLAAGSVGAGGRVVAIEALPRLHPFLIDNFAMNGFLDRFHLLPFAVADREGELTFYDFARYNGGSTAVPRVAQQAERRLGDTPREIRVQSKTLSNLLREAAVTRADLIKIDVEGFEWEVLQGARDFLKTQDSPHLLLEWHNEFMPSDRRNVLYRLLVEELGCSIQRIEPTGSIRPIGFDELVDLDHADLFVHRDQHPVIGPDQ